MKDTHPVIEERLFRMVMEKTGEERLKMGFEMCATAKKLVIASILNDRHKASERDIKVAVFNRFYGIDLSPEIRRKVIKGLRKRTRQNVKRAGG